jgi:UDP-N-acetylmuramoylalanine--D-glutamate ligase
MIKEIKNKKVLIFGLGILGGGREAARWFYKNGAKIVITDKKTKKELLHSIKKLKKIKAKYVLGKHRFEDIDYSDIVYFNPGVSYKSQWAQYAKEKGKEVVNDCYLFFKYAKGDIIAITGTRGKTTTTTWIYELLTQTLKAERRLDGQYADDTYLTQTNADFSGFTRPTSEHSTVWSKHKSVIRTASGQTMQKNNSAKSTLSSTKSVLLGGNQPEKSLFKVLNKAEENTVSVLEISSFQLEFYSTADLCRLDADSRRLSNIKAPKIAIITNIYNDHLNRYSDFKEYASVKARIFQNQTEDDYLILNLDNEWTKFFLNLKPKSQVYFVSLKNKPKRGIYIKDEKVFIRDQKEYQLFSIKKFKEIYGEHNLYNLLFAVLAVYLYLKSKNIKNPQDKIKKFKKFILNLETPKFRQEIIYKNKNLIIVNDSAATSPDATINAIERFKKYKNLILITGGTDKNLDFKDLAKKIKKEIKPENLILLNGSATKKLIEELRNINYHLIEENIFEDLRRAVIKAVTLYNSRKIYPNNNRIKYLNNHRIFGKNSSNKFGIDSDSLSVVLFSPASASFEKFKNEFDRGKKFNKIINYMLRLIYISNKNKNI